MVVTYGQELVDQVPFVMVVIVLDFVDATLEQLPG